MSQFESETVAPGTGETPGPETQPSAGDVKTETPGSAGPPETVPYARFREVNDRYGRLKDFEPLVEYGYGPDSLARLAQFEASYMRDPTGTLSQLVDSLDDLPDEAKSQVKELLEAAGVTPDGEAPRTDDRSRPEEPPSWAKPLIERHNQELVDREERAREEALDSILDHWDGLDKEAGIDTPLETKLAYIAANARNGSSTEAIAEAARQDALGFREKLLGDAVTGVGNRPGSPRSVPAGAVPPSGAVAPKNLEEATAMARQAIEAGTLPKVLGG